MEEQLLNLKVAEKELEITFVEYDDEDSINNGLCWHCWISKSDSDFSLCEDYGNTPSIALRKAIERLEELPKRKGD